MLHTLRIQNYALIDDVEVEFGARFNVLTGETGAGKSIIIHALNLILGARASSEAVRSGTKQAKIDAIFVLESPSSALTTLFEDNAIELDNGELHITRIVSAEGRSRAYVCGSLIPVNTLAAIGDELIDLHGQHEHQSLLHTEKQRDLLDSYSASLPLAEQVNVAVQKWNDTRKSIEDNESSDRDQVRQIEFLRYELDEINNANLELGEDEAVESRRNRIMNSESIFQASAQLLESLSTSETTPPALDQLDVASRELENLSSIDPAYAPILDSVEDIREQLVSQIQEIQQMSEVVEYDPNELDTLNLRLNTIRELKRKYGDSIESILAYAEESSAKITAFEDRDSNLAALKQEEAKLYESALKLAKKLSNRRKKHAKTLSSEIGEILQELGMSGATFDITFKESPLSLSGIDDIEFQLMANPGEPAKPLRQVASGGEVSRIMLAIKSVFAETDAIPTLIFDEIDTGVGGAIANQIAGRLKVLSSNHQTICITHLPQIAAAAHTHYHVTKSTSAGKTSTRISLIESADRVEEVARLLDGAITPLSTDHAKALLEELA